MRRLKKQAKSGAHKFHVMPDHFHKVAIQMAAE